MVLSLKEHAGRLHLSDCPSDALMPPTPKRAPAPPLLQSVEQMQRVIELARVVRERHNRPVKTPLRELVVVHPDEAFLSDIAGAL